MRAYPGRTSLARIPVIWAEGSDNVTFELHGTSQFAQHNLFGGFRRLYSNQWLAVPG
jgi:hypothetical protein